MGILVITNLPAGNIYSDSYIIRYETFYLFVVDLKENGIENRKILYFRIKVNLGM